jgi:hypothetical protein
MKMLHHGSPVTPGIFFPLTKFNLRFIDGVGRDTYHSEMPITDLQGARKQQLFCDEVSDGLSQHDMLFRSQVHGFGEDFLIDICPYASRQAF